ncbi:hypothetical protein [Undibacterium crateris]|uniref:hypothetical protein n=1 Tax=Undibacterium crateris TaxID=2528175 RepID=UPI00138A00BD|nr:hypothetical protein [Undibacterium crateris]NDI85396.1 hypothetical protein [Undibacterium crateris]
MNHNIYVKCDVCSAKTHCRVGLSNRTHQPIRFRCQGCGAPIDITVTLDHKQVTSDIDVGGAEMVDGNAFEGGDHFVDLHLDFPVSFGKYMMGHTPFMMAMKRIGDQNMQIHAMRLNWLNNVQEMAPQIKALFTLYVKGKHELFKEKVWEFLDGKIPCDTQLDINRALYMAIEKAFFPFAEPKRNVDAVTTITKLQMRLAKRDKAALNAFVDEIVDTGFLRNLQLDCLEIYPKIIDLELMFRPALFLDFDETYGGNTYYRVSAHEFDEVKDLFKDIAEIMSRAVVLVAGLNNLNRRGDHNKFSPAKNAPSSLKEFADWPLGLKLAQLDNCWYHIDASDIDHRLRNSIAHYKAESDKVTQVITYYPKKEGLEQATSFQLQFLDFSRKILGMFRETHRLNHLTKCLFVYYYLDMQGVKGTPFYEEDEPNG